MIKALVELQVSRRWLRRVRSPVMWRHVALVKTDVSKERVASIFRLERGEV
jgi:hypothetical protein